MSKAFWGRRALIAFPTNKSLKENQYSSFQCPSTQFCDTILPLRLCYCFFFLSIYVLTGFCLKQMIIECWGRDTGHCWKWKMIHADTQYDGLYCLPCLSWKQNFIVPSSCFWKLETMRAKRISWQQWQCKGIANLVRRSGIGSEFLV